MTTYEIQARTSNFPSLEYKGEGMGNRYNFSNNPARENVQFNHLEDAILTAESLLPEFDAGFKIQIFAYNFAEMENGDLDFIDYNLAWEKACTANQ